MAKNFQLIKGRDNNWEVALFLLLNHLFPEIQAGNWFSRTTVTSTLRSHKFIENLLGPIWYEINNSLERSISSAVTKSAKVGFIICIDGQCKLTPKGFQEFKAINSEYVDGNKYPIGCMKSLQDLLNALSEDDKKNLIANFDNIKLL